MDIAVQYPVLYVALYKKDVFSHEKDDFHWAFLIGPSTERAESEGVRCRVDLHPDSNGWTYSQTIVPLRGEDDLLARMMVAEIENLGPLGEIIRDQDATPTTEPTASMTGDSDWNSLEWVREKLEVLERKSGCLVHRCANFSKFEQIGRQLVEGLNQQRKKVLTAFGVEVRTLCLVKGWENLEDDETKITVEVDLARGKMSRATQIVTGILGAAALEMRRLVFERERRELEEKQDREGVAGSESARVTAIKSAKMNKPGKEFEEKKIAKEDGKDEDESEDEEESEGAGSEGTKPEAEEAESEESESEEAEPAEEVESAEEEEEEEEEEEDEEEEDEEEEEKESDEDDDDDEEEDDDNEADNNEAESDAKRIAEKNTGDKTATARQENVRIATIQFVEPKKPGKATGENNIAKENEEDEDKTESENETEDDEDEDEEQESSDEDEDEDEDEEKDEDEDEDEDKEEVDDEDEVEDKDEEEKSRDESDDEENKEYGGPHNTVDNISTITLSRSRFGRKEFF